jgi:hypothetical protein
MKVFSSFAQKSADEYKVEYLNDADEAYPRPKPKSPPIAAKNLQTCVEGNKHN